MTPGFRRGTLIHWNDERGFGFIQPVDGSREVFLHITALKQSTRRPQLGDVIYYYLSSSADGKISARDAFILGARDKSAAAPPERRATGLVGEKMRQHPPPNTQPQSRHSSVPATSPWLDLLLLTVPILGAANFAWTTGNWLPLLFYPLMSVLTYALYAEDKNRAQRNQWRVSEKTLHLFELAGGWGGAFLAQQTLRHKTRKQSYQFSFWCIVILHISGWVVWLIWGPMLL
ncbi:MAG: cold shock and DUF1294 domain-containing protein [Synechococcales cyanobacterium C42_A2020_086]|jgi:uncharacterized membrane protein YsdA (DUF1294 family)/cold shock CspA family protein|nr:cold shock and DUF1294 domain-containing protein [Synechococcales cyanobacterium C42_A2020_086]